jgi:hypothetical protein
MISLVSQKEAPMRKPTPILLSVTILLIVSLACGLPSIPITGPTVPTLDSNNLGTVIARTMESALTQTAVAAMPINLANSQTAAITLTPTFTPSATLSPTPVYTATPLVPMISVSVDTNCRVGPGQVYDRVGALLVGETTEVFGRDPTARYWYVRNPDKDNQYCWLWTEYATVVGNVSALPFYTPPPTPTPPPSFEAAYGGLEECSGWWVDIELKNTSSVAFKSVSISVRDLGTDADISLYADRFTAIDDCVGSTTRDTLEPGQSLTVSTPAFAYDPDGHKLRATITLCSAPGQKGACVTNVIKFSP